MAAVFSRHLSRLPHLLRVLRLIPGPLIVFLQAAPVRTISIVVEGFVLWMCTILPDMVIAQIFVRQDGIVDRDVAHPLLAEHGYALNLCIVIKAGL